MAGSFESGRLPDAPSTPEWLRGHEQVPAEARSILWRQAMAREMPGGEMMLAQGAQKLEGLYGQTVDYRFQTLGNINAASLQSQLDASLRTDSAISKQALSKLRGIVQGLDLQGKNSYLAHYKMRDGTLVPYVEFEQIADARKAMDAIPKELLNANPQLSGVLSTMRGNLAKIEATDPVRKSYYEFNQTWNAMRGSTDYRPVRALAGVGGALITALGLGIAVKDTYNNGELTMPTWPTGLWAFVTYMSATGGGMFRSQSALAQEQIAAFGIPQVKELTSMRFFKGPKGAENFLALQETVGSSPDLRKFLRSGKEVTATSLAPYISPESDLGRQLAGIPKDKLALTLSVFGERMPQRKKDLYAELLRTYDQFKV